ncbi:Zinc finger, PMZ-type [Sesbania bispinosa]|nr:Zinc finger, PMZ-type [Sesbania bispinosa]
MNVCFENSEGGVVFENVDDDGGGDSGFAQESAREQESVCAQDSGGPFFFYDENWGTFIVGEDWEDNEVEDNVEEDDGDKIVIATDDDFLKMWNLGFFSPHEIEKYEFTNMEVAYNFYFEYGKANGFGIRRGRTLRNKRTLEEYQKEFMCCRAGVREDRGLRMEDRVREPRPETRCECEARFVVHVNKFSVRWYCICFVDKHNHDLLGVVHCSMLPVYRKISKCDVLQMNNIIKVGIRPPIIFSSFANQSGGYEKIGFRKKDMYNKINEQRRKNCSDAKSALQYLGELRLSDDKMYFEHTVDAEGRLQHLFWSDGMSQVDYKLFGEVLAFDATYGVNNHNHSTIFAAAIIANETEETYVWLLEQFSKAMKGKLSNAVITDGDLAMKNAIERVFPNAYHRLCAWHLMRNTTSNVKNADFTKSFEKCMLGYYDVGTFRKKRCELVATFGVEENPWVISIYEKRTIWATAYLRGKFFGGFRTTSRCEGLHSELAKFVNSRYNLSDFLQHFHRCLSHMRFKEKEDEFSSLHGEPAVRCTIFTVRGQSVGSSECRVCLYPCTKEMKCACMKMECRGIPCEHIVSVLAHLGIDDIPDTLILNRWSKYVKAGLDNVVCQNVECFDAAWSARRASLNGLYDHVSCFKAGTIEKYNAERERILADLTQCRAEEGDEQGPFGSSCNGGADTLRNPVRVGTKGSGVTCSSSGLRVHKKQNCSICKLPGHNKLTCPSRPVHMTQEDVGAGPSNGVHQSEAHDHYEDFDPEQVT